MTVDLSHLRLLASRTTPGPWHVADRGIGYEVHLGPEPAIGCWSGHGDLCVSVSDELRNTMTMANAQLIVAMRNALPALLSRLAASEAVVEAARKLMSRINAEDCRMRFGPDSHGASCAFGGSLDYQGAYLTSDAIAAFDRLAGHQSTTTKETT